MSVRANVDDLRALKLLLHSGDAKKRLLEAAASEARRMVQMGFRTETDPSGKPWVELKYRSGRILRKTARMANSFTARATDRGFIVGTNVEYAKYHQEGTQGHSKDFTRSQAAHQDSSGKLTFVRKSGKARVRGSDGKRKWTYLGYSRHVELHFKQGAGKIPVRQMVPPSGVLTDRWQQSIDKSVNEVMKRMLREAGGR